MSEISSKNIVDKRRRRGSRGNRTSSSVDKEKSLIIKLNLDSPDSKENKLSRKIKRATAMQTSTDLLIENIENLKISSKSKCKKKCFAKDIRKEMLKKDPREWTSPKQMQVSQRDLKQKQQYGQRQIKRDVVSVKFGKHIRSKSNRSIAVEECGLKQCGQTTKDVGLGEEKVKMTHLSFPNSFTKAEVRELLQQQDSRSPEYVEGYLRINPKFHKHAYVSISNGDTDLLIVGFRDRNRALEGDLVVAKIHDERHCQAGTQKTGSIVCILDKVHSRKAIGSLKQRGSQAVFYPRDRRFPILLIYDSVLNSLCLHQPALYENVVFLAELIYWKKPNSAYGKINTIVGNSGDLKVEINAILLENDLNVTPYNENLLKDVPTGDYTLTSADMKDREDWRGKCTFTIDPATAADLDDAVSCQILDNGNYEIGVHIADVSHYLKYGSLLDTEVSKRATTVYLTADVYHMLPKPLCQLCSLLPGEDKLTFSVIWEMTPDARIITHRFAKTIINSCCQMAYEQAQNMIINPVTNEHDKTLKIRGNYTASQLSEIVKSLYKLSAQMRNKRFSTGALQIEQPKLQIAIDRESRLPISYSIEELKESNSLIEEFMLLANSTVATHLYRTIPETALLRNHTPPSERILLRVQDILQNYGVHLSIESSESLHGSLKSYQLISKDESDLIKHLTKYRTMVINNLCSKAMNRAKYVCASAMSRVDELKHYALNVSFYTHFTSPMRRYSDCIVHRLLYATIKNSLLPEDWSAKLCSKLATNCNWKKYCAKLAQEQCNELYFTYLLTLTGPVNTIAIALDIKERSVDLILCQVGLKIRVYFADMENVTFDYSTENSVPSVTLKWDKLSLTQVIDVFTILYIRLEKHPDMLKLNGTILPPHP